MRTHRAPPALLYNIMEIVHLRSVAQGSRLTAGAAPDPSVSCRSGETSIFITNGDMSAPPSLEGPGSARADDPETSQTAAKMNKPLEQAPAASARTG